MIKFENWGMFESWLESKGLFHMELGLGRMRKALALFSPNPQAFPVAQILGTNGKGSTAAFVESLARASGLKTGLFLSPHFISVRERILIDGKPAPVQDWLELAPSIAEACPDLTYFEFLTILALRIFRRHKIDAAIFEAGLGGRNDATSAIEANIQAFAPIAMDHAAIIGPGLADIAADKADAIKKNAVLLSAPQYPAAMNRLLAKASNAGSALKTIQPVPEGARLGLAGRHQRINAGLALAVIEELENLGVLRMDKTTQKTGLELAFIPGRLQTVNGSPCYILDGAHNPHGVLALSRAFDDGALPEPDGIIWSCLADKNWRDALTLIGRRFPAAPFFVPQLPGERAADAREVSAYLAQISSRNGYSRRIGIYAGPEAMPQALAGSSRAGQTILCAGSLFLLAEIYKLYPEFLSAPARSGLHEAG